MSISLPTALTSVISLLFVATALAIIWQELGRYETFEAVEILAAQEPELGLPVFAQFTVAQTVALPEEVEVTHLTVPMYVSEHDMELTITARQDGRDLSNWRLADHAGRSQQPAVVPLVLPFDKPLVLRGELTILFDGSAIAHELRERAPRVFVEPAGERYPGGGYRIAQNEKGGDVGLTVWAHEKRWERLRAQWDEAPLEGVRWAAQILLVLLALAVFPFTVRAVTLSGQVKRER